MEEQKRVIEKIPEDQIGKLKEKLVGKSELLQNFLQINLDIMNAENTRRQLFEQLKINRKSFELALEDVLVVMGLNEKKDYIWRFNGVDAFIGIPRPQQPPKQSF